MAVQQPPRREDPIDGAWDLSLAKNINGNEQRLVALLRAIQEATDLNDLKERTRDL